MRDKKYVFHYGSGLVYWTYARSIKGVLRQVDAVGMDVPACIEDCRGPEIWWREDAARDKANRPRGGVRA